MPSIVTGIEAAEVSPGETVLEVGVGSGYAAAVISQIPDRVYAIERHRTLGEAAERRFKKLGYDNIDLRVGDGTTGCRTPLRLTPSSWRRAGPSRRLPLRISSRSAADS